MSVSPEARDWLGRRVQVHPAYDTEMKHRPMAEGVVVGFSPAPSILVRAEDGTQTDWQVTLPIRVVEQFAAAPAYVSQEERDRDLIARHLRAAASATNITDWPAYLQRVADGHRTGTSWYRP